MGADKTSEVRTEAEQFSKLLLEELDKSAEFIAEVRMTKEPRIDTTPSATANAAFSCFNPDALGEIEFHGSRRLYARESVNNIRLNVGDRSEERRSRFLYDLENKYKNIKTQLGEEYVAAVIRGADPQTAPLQKSIKELFRTFFPGKEFLGVSVGKDNAMTFPVRLDTGEVHDIDELSSGEKEIVYGYLWLRTGTPRRSIVLVDEPELHLNPALVQGLPAFYKSHIADALEAQVWIVTHSDAILRQAVRGAQMAVYHMSRPLGDATQQAVKINNQDAVEAAVLELVGDLAAYRPYAKIVLVEGHKETRFDVDVIRRLFPDFAEKGNFVPAGNRRTTAGVRIRLLEVLAETGLTGRAVSISDGDLGLSVLEDENDSTHFTWPVYEIENFLLEPDVLRGGARLLLGKDPFESDSTLIEILRELAAPLVAELAVDEVQYALNQDFIRALSIGGSRKNAIHDLRSSTEASKQRISAIDTSESRIESLLKLATDRFHNQIKSLEFLRRFPGDRLMRALAGHLAINGDHYRNACLDQAQRIGFRPSGMEKTLEEALK